jgi:DNA repair exonuclease SbcCD nuclease subunit
MAVVSDIHLGHARNSSKAIVEALDAAFPDNTETGELDIIFLAGDVFDRLLDLPNNDVSEIQMWMQRLLWICSKHNISLRVLEGTPSHDWRQSKSFEDVLKMTNYKLDFKYVTDLSIEHVERFGVNVLYVPDEWGISSQNTFEQVQKLLEINNLTKVDYAIMHGQFDYQAQWEKHKSTKDTVSHDSQAYLDIVKHYIFIGHIHTHSTFDRIIAQGSFDRLSHGEEEPKGHVRATVNENGEKNFFFVENKLARIYKTVNCKKLDLQQTLEYVKKKVEGLPLLSCVRVSADATHPIFGNMNQLANMYPLIIWTKLPKVADSKKVVVVEETQYSAPIAITKENVSFLLKERMIKSGTDHAQIELGMQLLSKLI